MQGLMMNTPLMISSLIRHADRYHGDAEIVSRTIEGPIHRYAYRDAHTRARKLARALVRLGAKEGDRVATLAWNGYRHFELYYAISGMGAITHTINPRLFHDQLVYIVNHAEDTIVFFDLSFVALAEKLAPACKTVKHWVAMTDAAHLPQAKIPAFPVVHAEVLKAKQYMGAALSPAAAAPAPVAREAGAVTVPHPLSFIVPDVA